MATRLTKIAGVTMGFCSRLPDATGGPLLV
jgi:hypothetical protein